MNFKEWYESKIIKTITNDEIEDIVNISSCIINIDIDILKNTYNFYKDTDLMNFISIYPIINSCNCLVTNSEDLVELETIFISMSILNTEYNCKKIINDKNLFKDRLINNIKDNNFYVLLSLNPQEMKLDYIEKVEEVLNKNITKYTNLDLLYKEFVELYTNDIYFKSIILSNFRSFGIVLFDTLDEYNDYLENRKYYDISYLDTLDMEKLYDFINHIQDSDNSSNEDEDIILN